MDADGGRWGFLLMLLQMDSLTALSMGQTGLGNRVKEVMNFVAFIAALLECDPRGIYNEIGSLISAHYFHNCLSLTVLAYRARANDNAW